MRQRPQILYAFWELANGHVPLNAQETELAVIRKGQRRSLREGIDIVDSLGISAARLVNRSNHAVTGNGPVRGRARGSRTIDWIGTGFARSSDRGSVGVGRY